MSATKSRVDRFLTKMTHDMSKLKTSLQFSSDDIADLKSSMAELAQKSSVNDVQPMMTRQVKDIKEDLQSRANLVDYLDNCSRRNCIRIDGIQESPKKDWKTIEAKVQNNLKNKMHIDDSKIDIERAHRISKSDTNRPKQRSTNIRLLSFKDREEISE